MKRPLFVFAHGAGAPSSSDWMQRYKQALSRFGTVHSFDYEYMQAGRRSPDRLPKLLETHRSELAKARRKLKGQAAKERPVVLIGKSMGGRVGCHLALEEAVHGVVCLGYPLKSMGKNAKLRDEVLLQLRVPVLFVQGTRDNLCPLELLAQVRKKMLTRSELYVVEGGNHSLEVTKTQLKQQGVTQDDVEGRIMEQVRNFCAELSS